MMLNTVLEMYRTLAKNGEENLGTQALIHYYDNDEKAYMISLIFRNLLLC